MPPRSYYARIASDILREEHQTNGLSTGALSRIFEVQPVPLKQFIADPYYGISKYDASLHLSEIQEDFVRHFEMVYNMDTYIAMVEEWGIEWTPPRRVNELTAMWGKGAGKDMVARVGFTRLADLLLSLRSPQKYFGIPETDIIHMLNVAASAPQAHRAFYRPLRNLLVAAPRFKDEFLMPPGDLASSIKFSKGIELVSGHSEAETLEGLNLIASCADEISAFKTADELKVSGGKTSNRTADYILDMLRSSSRTRFAENFKLAIISYPRRKDDAVMQALARAEMDINRNGENSRSYASGPHPTWEVNPRQNRAAFQPDYDTDPEMARAKYECDPPLATDRFLRNDYALNNAFSVERLIPPIEVTYFWGHPEAKDVNLLNEEPIEGWQVHYTFAPDFKPMDGALYALHGDLAVRGDRAGLAMSHVKQYQRLVHPDEDLGFTDIEEMRPIMTVDFVLGFEAELNARDSAGHEAPREVELRWYRQLIWELMKRGFNIASVTFDGFQSVDMIQILKMYGVAAARLSLDRGDKVYQSFKEALYSSRIIGYQHTALVEEFRKLMHTGRKVDHPPGGCFVGDTRIPLLDGTYPEIRDLDGKSVWVYSSTPDGQIVPGLARGRMTKETAELVDVILDNGYVARCTPEHRWMLRDGSYKEARLLKPGVDRLMPITFNWPINGGYTRLANKDGYRVLAHHMVSEFFEGRSRESDEVVHHINEVKTDNRPENLEMLTQLEHTTRHATERWDAIKPAFRNGYSVWIADEDKKKEVYSRRRNWRTRHDVTLDTILQAIMDGASNRNEVARLLKCDWNVISARLKKESLSFSEAIDLSNNNHKVRAVVPVYLDTPVPVYDLEVERFNNFALTGGVFVHNSKDLADSVAGAIYGAAVLVAGEGEDPISRYDAEPFSMSIPVSRIAGGFGSSDMGSLGFGGGGMSAPLGFG